MNNTTLSFVIVSSMIATAAWHFAPPAHGQDVTTVEPLDNAPPPVLTETLPSPSEGILPDQALPLNAPPSPACPHCDQPSHGHYLRHCDYGVLRHGYINHRWHHHIKPWLHATHWGYSEYFVPEPLGGSVYAHMNAQIGNAQAAQLVLYHFDFEDGPTADTAMLNSYGVDRLRKMMRLYWNSYLPIVVQRSRHAPQLNEARRRAVIEELAKLSPEPIQAERIIVADPVALGMRGIESLLIYQNQLKQTEALRLLTPTRVRGGAFRP